ncbi:hypothetical protein CCH79_00016193 [Gambusia affinis]|uniref:Peptidase C80 domain-containing protein n=1 Tax=Gambusia affinis TaxID=33528 RepID=A0A315VLZ2_GAMAF|nr:hypothetical protein CCH79_00016193 [Gambusia affinis]
MFKQKTGTGHGNVYSLTGASLFFCTAPAHSLVYRKSATTGECSAECGAIWWKLTVPTAPVQSDQNVDRTEMFEMIYSRVAISVLLDLKNLQDQMSYDPIWTVHPEAVLACLEPWANHLCCAPTPPFHKDLGALLDNLEKQKTDDWLITASEISHSYGQKLLIVTDKEPSTSERVRQEYAMDPHYSVIVHVDCMNNESCVPEVDRNTVVKIFGHVSEDGQTVSGLSGSSLADLILKPGLEAAAVFSLNGNTTTEFQHSFIRVLMVRGSKAALETVQDNHQIYQIMEQSDSVSTYKIPERPLDHSSQYDNQQIIILEDNEVVRTAAESLYEKHPTVSSLYVLDNNLKPRLIHGEPVPLSENSRLVLIGHGARGQSGEMKLAEFKSPEVSKIIQNTHRVSDKIKTTSVVACDVGSDESFVETLAKELHQAGIETELHLRNSELQTPCSTRALQYHLQLGEDLKHLEH